MATDRCPFYLYESTGFFSSKETCTVTNAEVSSVTYKEYCNGYYDKCPNFKRNNNSSSGTGCYLTSACVEAMGLCDCCMELTVLRDFRDNWLANQPDGQRDIDEYYKIAPEIVKRIHESNDRIDILKGLYEQLVKPCVEYIRTAQYNEAWALYRCVTNDLKTKYL